MSHVYYYSWSGKTRYCADAAARILNCGITEIIETLPRKKSILGFLRSGYEASTQKTSEIRALPDVEVDHIILAFPIWAGKAPPAVNTTLRTLNFSNRRVLVLNTVSGESKSIPSDELVRSQIVQRGGSEVSFIRIVTSRSSEADWESTLRRELAKLKLIN